MLGVPLMSKTIYAIHVAAELGDADMVEMLMKAKAKRTNSRRAHGFDGCPNQILAIVDPG